VDTNNLVLEARNITKTYGAVEALKNVNFQLRFNEVIALLGDNGAGKSTFIKILSGAIRPSSGQILIDGKPVIINNTKDAKNLGIETIYQDLALVDCLSIEQNIYLGKEIVKNYFGLEVLQNHEMKQGALKFLNDVGVSIFDTSRLVSQLSGGQRHAVAISKGAFWTEKILILDEPTAALGVKETARILDLILELKNKGLSIIFITHNMQDAFKVADSFFVLRLGQNNGSRIKAKTNPEEIVKLITGTVA
jgi:ABC-type sugar transport system ATPase subunit